MLVSPQELAARLADPGVVVVDMRWREDGSARLRYEAGHVPGAVFLDWATDLVDPDGRFAFMLAPPERFARAMERAGISDGTTVVAYADRQGSGPFRLWWACRVYGHDDVLVLDGGFGRWLHEGRPVEAGAGRPDRAGRRAGTWTPRALPGRERLVAGADDVAAGEAGEATVLDSRPPEQFRGEAVWFETGPVPAGPDGLARTPRGDLRAGRVPWAASVPAATLYRPDGRLLDPAALQTHLTGAGVDPSRPTVAYCGVAISASALAFAVSRAGLGDAAVYDASWEEWGRDPGRPVARG